MEDEVRKRVTPEQPAGVKDYLPEVMIPRQRMIDTIRGVYETFGFDPVSTPVLERFDVLSGGDPGFDKQIFTTKVYGRRDKELSVALRFDLTVPLARLVAANQDLPHPFKRYQVGNVFRGEQPQKGRYREFLQFDADIVGASTTQADVEIIQLMSATLRALGVGSFTIKINDRKILNGLPALCGFSEDNKVEILRILDKMDKNGWEGVSADLAGDTSTQTDSPKLTEEQIAKIKTFVDLEASTPLELIVKAEELFAGIEIALEGLAELREIAETLNTLGVSPEDWKIDFSVARGLGYYTGPVFESVLDDLPKIGSVVSGGRFDGLVESFVDRPVPATGASVGVDRLFAALQELGKVKLQKTMLQVLVMVLDKDRRPMYTGLASELREAGIRSSVYMGSDMTFKAQLAYAVKTEVPLVVMVGERELTSNTVTIKNLRTRKQISVPREKLIESIQALL